jgi:hypothetical protein
MFVVNDPRQRHVFEDHSVHAMPPIPGGDDALIVPSWLLISHVEIASPESHNRMVWRSYEDRWAIWSRLRM